MEPLQDSDPRGIASYRLDARLASGGMGIVYLGVSPGGRQVAIKLIRPELASDREYRERFRREVDASRKIGGFHTAAVVDADPDAGQPWMVTQYIAGPSLHEQVRRHGPLEAPAVLQLAAALAEGLRAIHAAGLVHRDLKPHNVIMAADGPRIIDFGIAKPAGAATDPGLTATGKVIGTPEFMSPEHFGDQPVGPASDVFALGSVLAFAATGRPPFAGGSFSATGYAIVNQSPDLRALPPGLREIAAACLAKDPGARPAPADLLCLLSRTASSPGPADVPGCGQSGPSGLGQSGAVAAAGTPSAGAAAAAGTPSAGAAAPGGDGLKQGEADHDELDQTTITRPTLARLPSPPATVEPVLGQPPARQLVPARRDPVPPAATGDPLPPQPQVRPARQGWWLVTVSVDGRWVATANGDGIISVWLADQGTPVRSWAAGARLRAMVAGPGDLLVGAGDDGRVRAWDVSAGTAREYLAGHVPGLTGRGARVRALALDRTGAWLAGSVRGRLLVWDVADPREPQLVTELPCTAEVTALAFDDTGWLLAGGDTDGKVHVWDLREPWDTGQADPLPDAASSGPVLAVAWNQARGRWLTVGGDGPFRLGTPLLAGALSPAGGLAAVIDDARRRVHLASLDDPQRLRTLEGNDLVVTAVAVAGPEAIVIGDSQGALRLWNVRQHTLRTIRAGGSPITAATSSPDGTRLAVVDRAPGVTAYELAGGSVAQAWAAESPEPALAASYTPDGKRLVTAGDVVRAWDPGQGKPRGTLPGTRPPAGMNGVRAVARDHAGTLMAAAWASGLVSVWNATAPLWDLAGHKGAAIAVTFAPRSGQLVTSGDDETIRVWDLGTGREVACHSQLGYRVTALAARPVAAAKGPGIMTAPDITLAAGCADGTVRLVAPAAKRDTRSDWAGAQVLTGHAHGITAMSFDPSGRWLATASRDGTVRAWDLATRSAVTVLCPPRGDAPAGGGPGHDGPAGWAAAVASADGAWHGLGSADGRIWMAEGLRHWPLPEPPPVSPAPRSAQPPSPHPSARRRSRG
jgi:serine/threonine protein kinase/WD40 repeat protein